jgi:hypothetical protein
MIEDHDRFSAQNPKLQIMWSPSSLGLYMRDPALYYLERVEGWREDPPPINLLFGKVYHEALERYDRAVLYGTDRETAMIHALQFAWDQAREPIHGWTLDDIAALSGKDAERAKNTEGLIRSIVWYCEEHGGPDDLVQPIWLGDKPAVEVEFQMPLPIYSPYGEQYWIGGVLDGIVQVGDELYVRERKTTASQLGPYYKSRFDLDPQIDTYALASKVCYEQTPRGVLVEATQIGKTFSRFGRFFQSRTPSQLDEWLEDICYWIKRAEFDAEQGHWPCNRATTSLYGGHPLYGAISRPRAVRQGYLDQNFVQERRHNHG